MIKYKIKIINMSPQQSAPPVEVGSQHPTLIDLILNTDGTSKSEYTIDDIKGITHIIHLGWNNITYEILEKFLKDNEENLSSLRIMQINSISTVKFIPKSVTHLTAFFCDLDKKHELEYIELTDHGNNTDIKKCFDYTKITSFISIVNQDLMSLDIHEMVNLKCLKLHCNVNYLCRSISHYDENVKKLISIGVKEILIFKMNKPSNTNLRDTCNLFEFLIKLVENKYSVPQNLEIYIGFNGMSNLVPSVKELYYDVLIPVTIDKLINLRNLTLVFNFNSLTENTIFENETVTDLKIIIRSDQIVGNTFGIPIDISMITLKFPNVKRMTIDMSGTIPGNANHLFIQKFIQSYQELDYLQIDRYINNESDPMLTFNIGNVKIGELISNGLIRITDGKWSCLIM